MKKIGPNFHKEIAAKMPKTKTIVVLVEDEEYQIVLKNFLTLEEKTALLEDVMSLSQVAVANNVEDGAVLTLLGIYKALTDIEFPELPEDQLDQFNWLLECGIMTEIQKNLKPHIIEETAGFLTEAFNLINASIDKEKAKREEEEENATPIKE